MATTDDGSPSLWIERLRIGETDAAERLWDAYYKKLVQLARRKLDRRKRLVGDEEDVALSAFKSFCRGVERGRFPQLCNSDDLWKLLVTITLHKVMRLVRDEGREKRGGGKTAIAMGDSEGGIDVIGQLASSEPTPEDAVQIAEEADRLLGILPHQELVELALLKMEGFTNGEIAVRWNKAERTVERKLNPIRKIWEKEALLTV